MPENVGAIERFGSTGTADAAPGNGAAAAVVPQQGQDTRMPAKKPPSASGQLAAAELNHHYRTDQ